MAFDHCCAQRTGMHITVVEARLIAIYLEGVDGYMPTLMPEATLPYDATLPPGACPNQRVVTEARPTRNNHISIPVISAETERVFNDTKLFISDLRSRLGPEIIEALECIRK